MNKLRTLGKRYARATAMAHTEALNALAMEFGFLHWKALTDAAKGDWHPNDEDIARADAFVCEAGAKTDAIAPNSDTSFFKEPEWEEGELCGHPYQIGDYLGDVVVTGKGWHLRIPEAPFKAPIVEIDERYSKKSPVKDPSFLAKPIEIAQERSSGTRTDGSRLASTVDKSGS